jgi:CheY-like chemotaxis protein
LDIAVLDFNMPGMDGCALAAELRKSPAFGGRPILVLSSGGRPAMTRANSVSRWLSKPVKAHCLQEALSSLLGGHMESVLVPNDGEKTWHHLASKFPLKILLAEDNRVNQKVAMQMLKKMGCEADLAENGLEAVGAALSQPYDLVLMDIQMPVMDGIEATQEILAKLKGNSPPLIVGLSAHALEESRNEALDEGMFDYLSKPVKIQNLVDVLEKVYKAKNR